VIVSAHPSMPHAALATMIAAGASRSAAPSVEHFGMPVRSGNLLLIGSAGGVPVLGAPGCARSRSRRV